MNERITVEVLGFEAFCGAEAAWDEMVAASAHPCPFLTHPWIRTWWEHFGDGQEFVGLVARRGADIVAGVPFALREARLAGLRLLVGEIVGTGAVPTRGMGLSDRTDLAVRADAPEALADLTGAVAGLLDRVDVLQVKGLDSDSAAWGRLLSGSHARLMERSRSPYLVLDGGWKDYVRSRSQKFRKNLKRYRRLLEERGPVEIARFEGGSSVEPWLDEITAVNERSWTAERGTNLFLHPSVRDFLADLVRSMARKGWLELHVLRLERRPAAYELAFDIGNRVFAYNASYRADVSRFSPGTLVTAAVIESAFARGRVEYDMLRGMEGYKLRWSEAHRTESQSFLPAGRLRARLWTAVQTSKERLRRVELVRELDDRLSGMRNRRRLRA